MSDVPAVYEYRNIVAATDQPSFFDASSSGLSAFFRRSLLQKAISVFDFTLPKEWARNYFLYTLFYNGYIAVVNTDKYGVICSFCGLMGYDVYYQPTNATIANPLLRGILQPRIGKDCALIKMQPDYGGIMDTVAYYADLMAIGAESAVTNLNNSKLAYILLAPDNAGAATAAKLFSDALSGKPINIVDKQAIKTGLDWKMLQQNLKQNFIAPEISQLIRDYEDAFCREVGIPNIGARKAERLLADEVNKTDTETESRARLWLETMQDGCRQAREMFGIDIDVKLRREEAANDGTGLSIDPRPISV